MPHLEAGRVRQPDEAVGHYAGAQGLRRSGVRSRPFEEGRHQGLRQAREPAGGWVDQEPGRDAYSRRCDKDRDAQERDDSLRGHIRELWDRAGPIAEAGAGRRGLGLEEARGRCPRGTRAERGEDGRPGRGGLPRTRDADGPQHADGEGRCGERAREALQR